MPNEIINHGVKIGRKDSDYVAGVLAYFVRLLSGEWDKYAPPGMKQSNPGGDDMSCVTHSAIESIQTQEKFLTGSAPKYSPRWIAKMSGTTKDGNWLYKVVDAIRQYGLVLYEDYPNPPEPWTFEQYHAEIPEPLQTHLKLKGATWLTKWAVSSEWVGTTVDQIIKHLKQAPLQVIIPGHAIEEIRNLSDFMRFLDTYEPFIKETAQNNISDALKILLNPRKGQRMSNALLLKRGTPPNVEYGFFEPDINPSSLISSGLHHGIDIPKNPDGSVNFAEVEKLVQGTINPI